MIDPGVRARSLVRLTSTVPEERVEVLRFLLASPELASSLIYAVEPLLDDRTIATLYIPFRLGEIRNLAAEVVATARAYLNQTEPVVLNPGFRTMKHDDLGALAYKISFPSGGMSGLALYEYFRDHGHLKAQRLEFHPDWYKE
jgi:hypothetical protein